METNTAYCSNCGTKIDAEASFCPSCGKATPNCRPAVTENSYDNFTNQDKKPKDKIIAGLLCIFLGSIGVHYFYMDKVAAGLICIIITLISCGLWQVLLFIQGIYILTLTDEDFTQKYINNESTFPLF